MGRTEARARCLPINYFNMVARGSLGPVSPEGAGMSEGFPGRFYRFSITAAVLVLLSPCVSPVRANAVIEQPEFSGVQLVEPLFPPPSQDQTPDAQNAKPQHNPDAT